MPEKPTTKEERDEWRSFHESNAPSKAGRRLLRLIADVERLENIRAAAQSVIDLVETQPDFSGWPLLTASDFTEFAALKEALNAD